MSEPWNIEYPSIYAAFNELSLTGQKTYMRCIRIRVISLVAAAVGGAASLAFGEFDPFAWLALCAFIVAVAADSVVLLRKPDERWYEGRAATESVKTLTWRYAVAGDPFERSSKNPVREVFRGQIAEVSRDLQHVSVPPPGNQQNNFFDRLETMRSADLERRREVYIGGRIDDQIGWYSRKSRQNERRQAQFAIATVALEFLGVVGAALRISGAISFDALGIIAAAAAGIASWAQARQYGQLSRAYSIAAHELNVIKSEALDLADDENAWGRFVDEAEEAISREHTLWRASRGVLPLNPRRLA